MCAVEISDELLRDLIALAEREGSTVPDVIRQLVKAELAGKPGREASIAESSLPLIPAAETGPIASITGSDIDALFSRDHFPA